MSENVYNAGLPPRRHMGGGTITPSVSETSGLTRTRHFGSASSVVNSISQTASLVRPRTLYNDHLAVWTSGVYVRLDLPATPISLQDRADPSKWVLQVTNTGSATFKGTVSGAGFVGGSIDIPDTTTASSFHVDNTGKVWSGANASNYATAPFRVSAAGAMTASSVTLKPLTSTSVAVDVTAPTSGGWATVWRNSSNNHEMGAVGRYGESYFSVNSDSQGVGVYAVDLSGSDLFGNYAIAALNSASGNGRLGLGGGQDPVDAYVTRIGIGIMQFSNVVEFPTTTAPSASSTSNYIRLYNESGTYKWKKSSGTVYDLSKTLDNALTGDVTTVAGSFATTIANDAVTYAKMQNVSATSRFLGRITAGAGDAEELTAANAKTILALVPGDISGLTTLATDTLWDAVGDTVYGSGADTGAKLSGNVSTTPKYLRSVGSGSPLFTSAAPSWQQIASSDLSDNTNLAKLNASNTFTVGSQAIDLPSAANLGLIIQGAASHTGRLIELQYSDGTQAFGMGGSGADILATQYGGSVVFAGRRSSGTSGSPTASAADDTLAEYGGRGYGSAFATQSKAAMMATAAETWSATNQGTYIAFLTTKKTTTTRTEVLRLTDDGGMRISEVTTPAAPPANGAIIYADDNGAGKTRLLCLFNTGAAQVLATQP